MARRQMVRRITRAELVLRRLQAGDPKMIYAELLWVANQKQLKRGWVAHKFRAIFGKWPKPSTAVEPAAPCSDLLTWLDRERRNYGVRMKRQEAKAATEAEERRKMTQEQSAAILTRLEAILSELEANPLVLEPACQQDTDCEALDLAHGLEQRMRVNMEPVLGDTNAT